MTDRELMQMLLDALEKIAMGGDPRWADDVMPALRARLAQPELLPAKSKGALSHEENKQHNKKTLDKFYEENAHLYAVPPQREWQGLTDEEVRSLWDNHVVPMFGRKHMNPIIFGRILEAKLKEKNT